MKYIYSLVFVFLAFFLQAQHLLDNNWFFCYSEAFPQADTRVTLDFREAPPVSFEGTDFKMELDLTAASISDSEGDLLFYTNGCWIANREHELMLNGDGLNPGQVRNLTCKGRDGSYSSVDGALILPQPDNDSMYYLFHYKERLTDTFDGAIGIYYTLINMNLDGGLGGVVEKNIPMEENWVWNEELKAVRHANNRDWWVIIQDRPETDYLRWLLTPDGLEGSYRQANDSPVPHPLASGAGRADFSPDGRHYVRNLRWMDILLYDVDRATGELSNRRVLMEKSDTTNNNDGGGGVAYSPSGRYAYANSIDTIWQWDLEATDIAASRTVVGVYDGFGAGTNFPTYFYQMRLAPDCRIYIVPSHRTQYMHVINWPDRKGAACDVVQRAYKFDCFQGSTMPNFAHYRLGTGLPACDMSLHSVSSTVTSVSAPPPLQGEAFTLSPNPASSYVQLAIEQPQAALHLELFNCMGQRLKRYEQLSETMELSVSDLPSGIYFLILTDSEGSSYSQKLSINR